MGPRWGQDEAKTGQDGAKMIPREARTEPKGGQDGARMGLRSHPEKPWKKGPPHPFVLGPKKSPKIGIFLNFLGHFLDQFWNRFWTTFGAILGSVLGPDSAQEVTRWAQEALSRALRCEKVHFQKCDF